MLTRIYIEALLVDEELADQVWEAWDAGLIPDELVAWAWWSIYEKRYSTSGLGPLRSASAASNGQLCD
jgi:hypothetical protein